MPTFINQQLLGLTPGHINDIGQSLLINFLRDPFLNTLPNWHTVQARVWYPNPNIPLTNAVINLAIDFNALPVLQDDAPWLSVGGREMEDALLLFIRDLVTPYWQQSPSARLVAADPRGVNVDWMLVPDARSVGNTMSYVFQYLTPPGTPLDRTVESVQHNVTLAGNSTGIASKLKLATSSTVHLDANLTKRATDTCLDFYPNLLPFIQGGPITQVGTDSLACAS